MKKSFEPHIRLGDGVGTGESDGCAEQRNADAQDNTVVERLPIVRFGKQLPDILQGERRIIFRDEAGFEYLKQWKHHEQEEQHADKNNGYQDGGFTPKVVPTNEKFSRHHKKRSCISANQLPPDRELRSKSRNKKSRE